MYYEDIFEFVAKMKTIHTLLIVVSMNGWTLHHMDVKNAFLHGNMEEMVFMKPPPGCVLQRPNAVVVFQYLSMD